MAPCKTSSYVPVEIVIELAQKHNISYLDVDLIECGLTDIVYSISAQQTDKKQKDPKYSLPYCISAALIDKKIGPEHFTKEKINDERIWELAKKINLFIHPDLKNTREPKNYHQSHVRITLKNGKVYDKWLDRAKGFPGKPYSKAELKERFIKTVEGTTIKDKEIMIAYNYLSSFDSISSKDLKAMMSILA